MLKLISKNAFLLRIILAPFLPSRKYVRPISKYKAHILKYVRHIFSQLITGLKIPVHASFGKM